MKIQIASDLHRDFATAHPIPALAPDVDVAVFAGDLCEFARWPRFGDELAYTWADAGRIVYVPGNHEFYQADIGYVRSQLATLCGKRRIEYLDRRSVLIDGVCFIGATLWTDFEFFGTPESSQARARGSMSDFHLIWNKGQRFNPADSIGEHQKDVGFLDARLAKAASRNEKAVVVTHHMPSPVCVLPRFENDALNPAFVSDLDELILRREPALWIHGHTHGSIDAVVGRTRIVCNPGGYDRKENPDFDPFLVVEIDKTRHGLPRVPEASR
ncbi:MAG: metallophosphoesterase [Gammaproteobacteria bacterium]|nr:metallophosphoesterase [Gammaproteobacteria bacterium]